MEGGTEKDGKAMKGAVRRGIAENPGLCVIWPLGEAWRAMEGETTIDYRMQTIRRWIELAEEQIAARRASFTEELLVLRQAWLDTVKEWQVNPESVTADQFLAHLGTEDMFLFQFRRNYWRECDKGESPLSQSEKWKVLAGDVCADQDTNPNAKG